MNDVLRHYGILFKSARPRRPPGSYTASCSSGRATHRAEVGEEAVETAVAALSEGDDRLIYEMRTWCITAMVLLAAKEPGLGRIVEAELAHRFK